DPGTSQGVVVSCRRPEMLEVPMGRANKLCWHSDLADGGGDDNYLHIFMSEWQREQYLNQYGMRAENCRVIPNGADLTRFHPQARDNKDRAEKRYLLFASQPQRGLKQMLDIWPALREALMVRWGWDAELRVCGDFS